MLHSVIVLTEKKPTTENVGRRKDQRILIGNYCFSTTARRVGDYDNILIKEVRAVGLDIGPLIYLSFKLNSMSLLDITR